MRWPFFRPSNHASFAVRSAATLVAAALLLAPAPEALAKGAPVGKATVMQRSVAQAAYKKARAAYDAGRYEDALAGFNESFDTVASPNTRIMIAQSLERLGRLQEAYDAMKATADDAEMAARENKKYAGTAKAARDALGPLKAKLEAKADDEAGPAPADAAPEAAPASPADGADAAGEQKAAFKRLWVGVGGNLLRMSDSNEVSRNRGGLTLWTGFRPIEPLLVMAGYRASFGSWRYTFDTPVFDAQGPLLVETTEHRHRVDLGLKLDVLQLAGVDAPLDRLHLEPHLGLVYLGINTEVYDSKMFGGGGGLDVSLDVSPDTTLDGGFMFVGGGGPDSSALEVFGPVRAAWTWTGGASVGVTRWARLRAAYVGEALVREHTQRLSHGAELSFVLGFLDGRKKDDDDEANVAGCRAVPCGDPVRSGRRLRE